jgi:hypothetical protein
MGGGPARFYLFKRDGTVLRTKTKPMSKSDPIAHQEDTGYWFEKGSEFIYFSRRTRTEERLKLEDSPSFDVGGGDVVVDGAPGTSARRIRM